MLALDRDAFLCDLAETYGIYDMHVFQPRQVAMYAAGLRPDSRIRMRQMGIRPRPEMEVLAHIADNLAVIRHYLTGKKGDRTPILFTELIAEPEEKEPIAQGYRDGAAFSEAWNNITKGGQNG